ncbi:DUF2306 domain-containing protein [Microvirga terricola]|uniref:DUF2306 domain-containing protein n=1 Tax=Microvirga terricola TaxID=2719797 RepID=A0ABX0V5I7_9HYPH|nr:DUF2306 domain-containing protein [Microvirga terricola]NIX75115.1 DUF2306 domain-containing protein [Microvirga terricola]
MSLAPLIAAPLLIQVHAASAVAALVLGSYQMLSPKGTPSHRRTGWIWAALMMTVAVTSLGILSNWPMIGPFGPIHALSALTVLTLPAAVIHARRGRIAGHRRAMMGLFFGGLVVAGVFTLMPGRLIHQAVFGG